MHKNTWSPGSWRRDGMLRVLMQYRKFKQNFDRGPSPIQVKEQAQAESVAQWLWSSIRPQSPVKAHREYTAHREEQLITQRKQKPLSEGPSRFPLSVFSSLKIQRWTTGVLYSAPIIATFPRMAQRAPFVGFPNKSLHSAEYRPTSSA